jgi:hypothetical protein
MNKSNRIPLIKVNQWLDSWGKSEWSDHLPKPQPFFYIASMSLLTLRRLAGVNRREVKDRKQAGQGLGYQRPHQRPRSRNIARYLQYGYPLSNASGLDPDKHSHLIHPGWLPTSILVNLIGEGDSRPRGSKHVGVDPRYLVSVKQEGVGFYLDIPNLIASGAGEVPANSLQPIEIIDGQHRLFAIDEMEDISDAELAEYEVPVVFFDGLTPSWQAYLFWVINVEPKKINPSLAYDLYPELRNQSWLEGEEGIKIYQEHRSQELTEVLWRHPWSPWHDRIELHGQRVDGHVSNAAFIRSLMASFVRNWGNDNRIGGLFGSIGAERVLAWKRPQQAAFLMVIWNAVLNAVSQSRAEWVQALEKQGASADVRANPHGLHSAFAGPHSLLGTDQGARAILVVFNAICQIAHADLDLEAWELTDVSDRSDDDDVSEAVESFAEMRRAQKFIDDAAKTLVNGMDWRTSSAPGLSESKKLEQGVYRGSSGYAELQKRCFSVLQGSADVSLAQAATDAGTLLRR